MNPHLTGRQIVAFRDGESADPNVARHLESCESCRHEMESARVLANLLTPVPELVEDQTFSILDALSLESFAEERVAASAPGFPLELIQRSRSIGLLRVRRDANNVNFEYLPLEIDHSFLERPAPTLSPLARLHLERLLFRRIARPARTRPFTFNAAEFRFTVETEGESGSDVKIRIASGSDDSASACAGLEATLIDSENAPRIFSLDEKGTFHLELRSRRSILLLYTEPSAHLGIELSK
jgi:hypothetical protein